MRTSDQINDLAAAMVKAQAAMKPALKDRTNPAFKSKYADLSSVTDAILKPATDAGLTWWQDAATVDGGLCVTTRVVHVSGQWVEHGPLFVPVEKTNAHGVGSAISYARRYALSAAFGVTADDDDGNAAVDTSKGATAPKGYESWLMDMDATASNGSEAMRQAWQESKAEFRDYLTQHQPEKLSALRQKAKAA